MVKKTEIIANVVATFNKKSDVTISTAQSKLRDSLETFEKATRNAVSKLQVCSIALVKVVHAGAGDNGLDVVPDKKTLKELLKVQIDAIATNKDGSKDEVKARNINASAERIVEQAMLILKGDFIIAWSPKGNNVYIDSQKMKSFEPNTNIHEERVFRPSNVPFPKFKDNGNVRTNSPKDIVPVTVKDTQDTYGKEFLQKPLNAELTGFEVSERSQKVETVSNAKEALTATLGLTSWFKSQGFVDGQVTADLWDNEELDNLCTNSLFDSLHELSKLILQARTVADAQMAEHCLKKKESEENAKLKAEENLKFRKKIAEENPDSVKAISEFKKALIMKEKVDKKIENKKIISKKAS